MEKMESLQEEAEEVQHQSVQAIEDLFNQYDQNAKEEEKQAEHFEELKKIHKNVSLYGFENNQAKDARLLLKENTIEEMFPKEALLNITNFSIPKLEYQNYEDIVRREINETE